jgi:hypothetical protein
MKILVHWNYPELWQVDTPPPPQMEVDLADIEYAPKEIRPVVLRMLCLMVREAKFGVN